MANINKIIILGRLCQEPETFRTPKGTAVTVLHLVVNRPVKGTDGNPAQETVYIDATTLGKTAEHAASILVKGQEVFVEGRLRMQTWQDKETGKTRRKFDIVVELFQTIGWNISKPHQSELPIEPQNHNHSTYSGYAHDNQAF